MKTSVRDQAQQLLETLPNNEVLERLRWEFKRKGCLSKREMKELYSQIGEQKVVRNGS